MYLKWYGLLDFNETNVEKYVSDKGGNYMISVGLKKGGYRPLYLGKTKYLETRLLKHLSDDEENECLKSRVGNYELYFRYCYVDDAEGRTNIEYTLYKKYSPKCNKVSPQGKEILITFPY